MITLNTTPKLYKPAKANQIAEMLNADPDDDFEYRVKHDPKGTGDSLIEVMDDDGEFIGYMG